ncbi:MAG: DnaJ domain-containing protein [Clostridia bacterium]|nr:DnaJ domain-containing protein [Clostridia bacterium]
MTDPYQVLGVAPTASDDEVKKAYRTLCKRYHPDANVGKQDAAQAEKKFMEVQQAYEEIMHRRQGGGARAGSGYNGGSQSAQQSYQDPFDMFFGGYGRQGYSQQGYGQQGYGGYYQQEQDTVLEMRAAVNYINTGHYAEALNALGSVPAEKRNARWYYLNALAQSGLHNNAQAMEYARQAVSMEPGNMLYQQLLSQLQSGGSAYGQRGAQYGRQTYTSGSPCSNPCCSFLAFYACCNCCGGGHMMFYPLFCCL